MAWIRLVASMGAGGVIYLTPIVFHHASFSARAVTEGIGLAALAGTFGRLLSGLMLDRGCSCALPVLLAAIAAIAGDIRLLSASSFPAYLGGQILLGIAAGFYWPAIELAVPLSCSSGARPIPSARGYALVRSADAAGIAAGALLGALLAGQGSLRGIYAIDIFCALAVVLLLLLRPLPVPQKAESHNRLSAARQWLPPLLPVLAITLLATALPALMQSALPLDLVRGGLERPAMQESLGALLIGLQLSILVLIQWPLGQALAKRPVAQGLGLSLVAFACGTALLALSALSRQGLVLVVAAQLPLAIGEAAFLPIATEAVIELTPREHQGLAMALFSQCFAISALAAPLVAGWALEGFGNGLALWSCTAILCLAGLSLVRWLKPKPLAS
ncbi:MFS transporter [Cyanobium sp. HWJ4-Hawea]|uniref:MFS transporter n=1 Tax=Cyanobium sp. HWJ4-Hawea TaxID=2823713 RepID=UPI0020CDE8D1|nr:MFS transporter [Cyanobium sp. HWJ4-Hawea]